MNSQPFRNILSILMITAMFFSCTRNQKVRDFKEDDFNYTLEQFADLRVLRYQVPDFDKLNLRQKKLLYYLGQAALYGRDIIWDQNGKYNLAIRQTLENIYETYSGNRDSDHFKLFEVYLKRVWFSNGIYHHYASNKIAPGFPERYFRILIAGSEPSGFPLFRNKSLDETLDEITRVMFDKDLLPMKICLDPEKDLVRSSAVNFYDNVSQKEVEAFYDAKKDENDLTPVSYGLNSRLVKVNGKIKEETWKLHGIYGEAIERIIYWLEKAKSVADSQEQAEGIDKLIEYYKTGNLKTWDEYNIIWVSDTARVDFVNGFIEVYADPLGMKATWESVVNFKDLEATKRTETIAENAQWFEDHSPIDERFKKKEVKGVSAKVITVSMLGGECYPSTPIGINLPNASWIRKLHGSKSVTLENITHAYSQANLGSGFLEEFSYDNKELELVKKYGSLTDNMHTDLHECLGHGSGQLLPGISEEALKNYHSVMEETRADLFALYYIMDPKMVELGLLPDKEAAKAQYISYIRNGIMTQLRRIEPGNDIAQAHMRNRQLISKWCYEQGAKDHVIEKIVKEGKTYYHIRDFNKLRSLFGDLLAEVQRIKSEGDYKAARELVETYGVKVDADLHKEVLARVEKLNLAPYSGFVNPEYEVIEENGEIVDIKVLYVEDYTQQMLKYSREFATLPVMN